MSSSAAADRFNNLPTQLSEFVGRARETAVIAGLLHQDTIRLVTLFGHGGVGKTHLAPRLASDAAERAAFPDGVWFVPLAPFTDPALLIPAVAPDARAVIVDTDRDSMVWHASDGARAGRTLAA